MTKLFRLYAVGVNSSNTLRPRLKEPSLLCSHPFRCNFFRIQPASAYEPAWLLIDDLFLRYELEWVFVSLFFLSGFMPVE